MSAELRMEYALADRRAQFRIAAENPAKMDKLRELLNRFHDGRVLILGAYLAQVAAIRTSIGEMRR